MNGKIDVIKERINEIKKEKEQLRQKHDYLTEQMKKASDKHSQDIEFLKNEIRSLHDKTDRKEEKLVATRSFLTSLEKSIASLENRQSMIKEKSEEEMKLVMRDLNAQLTERVKAINATMTSQLKETTTKSLGEFQSLKSEAEKIISNLKDQQETISTVTDDINSLNKSASELFGITNSLKKDINEKTKISSERQDARENKLTEIRSSIISLEKSISAIDGKQIVLKEKMEEDMKAMARDLFSQLTERLKSINSTLSLQLNETVSKNLREIQLMKDRLSKLYEKNEDYEKGVDKIMNDINSIKKSVSELSGRTDAVKNGINEKIGLIEKTMASEIGNVRSLEGRLAKDVKDFENFASKQKSRMEEFESNVLGKIDTFAVKKENLKRDFESLNADFKNISGRIDSMRDKNSYFDHRLKNIELGLENLKKMTEETFSKIIAEQNVFKDGVVAKLNEASEKIINRLSQGEEKTAGDLAKQSEDIKVFRAHVTQFINDFVSNYEKRFEKMKLDIDQSINTMERQAKEQAKQPRAVIFE